MMPAAEVQPPESGKPAAEFSLKLFYRVGKRIGSLLAERVDMKALHALQQVLPEVGKRYAKAGAGGAGVVDRCRLGGKFRVDPDSDTGTVATGIKFFFLRKGIEHDMVADAHQLVKILIPVGRRKNVVFPSHLLFSETCLIKPACRGTRKVLPDQRIELIGGKRFLRKEDPAPGPLLHAVQNLKIGNQPVPVYDVDRGRKLLYFHFSQPARGFLPPPTADRNGSGRP